MMRSGAPAPLAAVLPVAPVPLPVVAVVPEPVAVEPVVCGLEAFRLVNSSWLNETATSFSPMPRKPPTPTTTAAAWPLRSNSTSFTSPIDSLLAPTTVVPISLEASHCPGCCCATNWPDEALAPAIVEDEAEPAAEPDMPEPDCPAVDDPELPVLDWLIVDEPPDEAGFVPTVDPTPGCMAEEPEVVEPEPVAAGRSVPPDGAGLVWAKAGAAASAVATRQAAICDFNIDCLPELGRVVRAHCVNATLSGTFRPRRCRPSRRR
jgi:hypothetical protein